MKCTVNSNASLSPCPHLQQLFCRQAEFRQRLGNFPGVFGESVGDSRHHSGSFSTAALRQEESDISVRDQTTDCLMKTTGVSEAHRRVFKNIFKTKTVKLCSKPPRNTWQTNHNCLWHQVTVTTWMNEANIPFTYCGCILYSDPSIPTVVRSRATPLFSFSLSRMPASEAAIRLAERKDTMAQTWRGEEFISGRKFKLNELQNEIKKGICCILNHFQTMQHRFQICWNWHYHVCNHSRKKIQNVQILIKWFQ